jgi:hypothetical protein
LGREKKLIPLKPVSINRPFEQWGIDIIREINPYSLKPNSNQSSSEELEGKCYV